MDESREEARVFGDGLESYEVGRYWAMAGYHLQRRDRWRHVLVRVFPSFSAPTLRETGLTRWDHHRQLGVSGLSSGNSPDVSTTLSQEHRRVHSVPRTVSLSTLMAQKLRS